MQASLGLQLFPPAVFVLTLSCHPQVSAALGEQAPRSLRCPVVSFNEAQSTRRQSPARRSRPDRCMQPSNPHPARGCCSGLHWVSGSCPALRFSFRPCGIVNSLPPPLRCDVLRVASPVNAASPWRHLPSPSPPSRWQRHVGLILCAMWVSVA